MIPIAIQESESALRRAVEQRQSTRVDELISSYCERTDAHLSTLAPGDPARSELLAHTIAVLKWTRLMLHLSRAGYSDRLSRSLLAKRYVVPAAAEVANVHMDC